MPRGKWKGERYVTVCDTSIPDRVEGVAIADPSCCNQLGAMSYRQDQIGRQPH
jgi:hypothetical protein